MDAAGAIELDGQYRLLREEAGFIERNDRAKLLVRGSDAAEFLQGQLTNDVEGIEPGLGCYAALLDRKGHMRADMRVLRLSPDEFWLDAEGPVREVLAQHLDIHRIGRDAEVEDASEAWTIISTIGPASAHLTDAPAQGPEYGHRRFQLDGVEAVVTTTDLGLDLLCAHDDAGALREKLLARGVAEVDAEAAEILRVESGRPRFGREMTTETIPQEAGINDRAVSFEKGCYIGQETVARLHYKGKPNRHLRGLRVEGAHESRDPIRLGDRDIGRLGTAVRSPAFGTIALAILRREAELGARVTIGAAAEGEVVALPFR